MCSGKTDAERNITAESERATGEMDKLCSEGSENNSASSCCGPWSQLIRLPRAFLCTFIEHLLRVVLFTYLTGKIKPLPISQPKQGG